MRLHISIPRFMRSALFVFAVCTLVFAAGMDRHIDSYDEGLVLTGAMRVAAGEIPHRDFYANYGPAQFAIIALLFKVFGQQALVERIYDLIIRAMIVAVGFRLLMAHCRYRIAVLFSCACTLWLLTLRTYGNAIFPILPLAFVGSELVFTYLNGHLSRWRLFTAGVTTGFIALFRYDVGAFVLIAHLCSILIWMIMRRNGSLEWVQREAVSLFCYVLGTALIFLPVAVDYLAVAPAAPFVHDILSFPTHYYVRMRGLPFPSVLDCLKAPEVSIVYLPVVVWLAAVYIAATGKTRNAAWAGRMGFVCVFGLLSVTLFAKGFVRASAFHMALSFIASFMVFAVLADTSLQSQRKDWRALSAVTAFWIALASLAASRTEYYILRFDFSTAWRAIANRPIYPPENVARTSFCLIGEDRVRAVRFIQQATKPEERIFVGVSRHDKIFANDNLTYFAAGRLPGTHWSQFDPGLQTRADIQSAIIDDLKAHSVRCVVLNSELDGITERNDSATSSGVYLLDDYIREHYQVVRSFGTISVLWVRAPMDTAPSL